ncbi:MAG: DNA repair protein RecN [Bacteroidetes bacterium]|nr:DNA repair protein RecN [Bacteroidota bacterium]
MLKHLKIYNYAIIESLQVDFSNHLNIITGETGAGKSILMGALSLILGERADTAVLLDKSRKSFVEGVFKSSSPGISLFLSKNELDEEDEIIIRREIASNGKSRAFINDSPVTLAQLRQLTSMLVDLHQQFDTLELNNRDFQLDVLDALSGNEKLLEPYRQSFKKYIQSKKELRVLKHEQETANKEFDYNQFLFDELEKAQLKENEIEETEAALKLMSNAEMIKEVLTQTVDQLQEGNDPLVAHLNTILSRLNSLKMEHVNTIYDRIKSVEIELKDISNELQVICDSVQYNAQKIELLNERMAIGYLLQKKHGVNSTKELLDIQKSLSTKLEKVSDLADSILQKEIESQKLLKATQLLAQKISEKRLKAKTPFEQNVKKLLMRVGMPNAEIKVQITPLAELNSFGNDGVEFLFNANKTAEFEPMRKVASGGELSRIMLVIKSLVARSMQMPSLIFDEIDSGISGEAARQVGMIIKELSAEHQIISITHQPQIAAKAHTHFVVFKQMENGHLVTHIKKLSEEERVTAIATMLSGKTPGSAAFANARELILN